jgi:hypothetical protein
MNTTAIYHSTDTAIDIADEFERLLDRELTTEKPAASDNVGVEEDFICLDHRTCNCELTYVHRKRHAALGVGIQIRLCCLAKKVEELAGLPPGTFFKVLEFEPTWVWDCDHPTEINHTQPDGTVVKEQHRLGPPPKWLLKRMRERGVEVKNLPPELE